MPGDAAASGMESAGAAILGREQDTRTGKTAGKMFFFKCDLMEFHGISWDLIAI